MGEPFRFGIISFITFYRITTYQPRVAAFDAIDPGVPFPFRSKKKLHIGQIAHDLDHLDHLVAFMRCCASSVSYRSHPACMCVRAMPYRSRSRSFRSSNCRDDMLCKIRIIQIPPGKHVRKSRTIQIDPTRKTVSRSCRSSNQGPICPKI